MKQVHLSLMGTSVSGRELVIGGKVIDLFFKASFLKSSWQRYIHQPCSNLESKSFPKAFSICLSVYKNILFKTLCSSRSMISL